MWTGVIQRAWKSKYFFKIKLTRIEQTGWSHQADRTEKDTNQRKGRAERKPNSWDYWEFLGLLKHFLRYRGSASDDEASWCRWAWTSGPRQLLRRRRSQTAGECGRGWSWPQLHTHPHTHTHIGNSPQLVQKTSRKPSVSSLTDGNTKQDGGAAGRRLPCRSALCPW